ncbi:MAG: radical SAM protein [bacterium]
MINLTKLSRVSENIISEMVIGDKPIVVWNMTRQCNLSCRHCYISAHDKKSMTELTTDEAKRFIYDLASLNVPVLLFSGGEPLLRKDIFELGEFAANLGIRPVISSNGTLISSSIALSIKNVGFEYVGISIDGLADVHNEFRGIKNGFQLSFEGIHNCQEAKLHTGIRFTVNKHNFEDLPALLDLAAKESIPRFCLYHLVYTGKGKEMIQDDLDLNTKINLIKFLIFRATTISNMEILTVDNPADGIYFYIQEKEPHKKALIETLLKMAGGCSAGQKIANVSPEGEIYPCQFWQDLSSGNVRKTPFSQIWQKNLNMCSQIKTRLKGKCGQCSYKDLCGGCRVRAKIIYGDYLAEDPACYIDGKR